MPTIDECQKERAESFTTPRPPPLPGVHCRQVPLQGKPL